VSAQALLDCFIYVAGHDFTTDSNQANLTTEAPPQDSTTFGSSGWSENVYGLKNFTFGYGGFWQSAAQDAVDPDAFGDIAVERAHTFGLNEVETEPCWLFNAAKTSYQIGGEIGPTAPFTLASLGSDKYGAVRGQLAKARGAMNATGPLGSVVQLGAVAANQYLYATFHIFTAGTTATIQVQSAPTAGFAAPTTRGTIGPLTARGGTFMTRVAGPITDTFWRFNVSAITGAFVAAGGIGIGS
jgi:hypothetical protein